jgi:hypothetical protein
LSASRACGGITLQNADAVGAGDAVAVILTVAVAVRVAVNVALAVAVAVRVGVGVFVTVGDGWRRQLRLVVEYGCEAESTVPSPSDSWAVDAILTICGWPGMSIPSDRYKTEVCIVAGGKFIPAETPACA